MSANKKKIDEDLLDRLDRVAKLLEKVGNEVLGQRVRRMRDAQGISIREVADRAGISKNSVVRLEQGRGTQAVTILKVCSVLGVHVERLADPGKRDVVVMVHQHKDDQWFDVADMGSRPLHNSEKPLTASQRKTAVKNGAQVPVNLLKCRLPGGRVLPSILELYGPSPTRSHVGEEFVYVVSGEVAIEIGRKKFRLKKGESMTFWSAEPHSYAPANPNKIPVQVLSVRVDG